MTLIFNILWQFLPQINDFIAASVVVTALIFGEISPASIMKCEGLSTRTCCASLFPFIQFSVCLPREPYKQQRNGKKWPSYFPTYTAIAHHLPQALQEKAEALTNAYTKAEASGIAVSNSHPICRNPTACLLHTTKKKKTQQTHCHKTDTMQNHDSCISKAPQGSLSVRTSW